ncbi:GNAT family N-acetyltransferase [Flavobacteriaceae bacterium 3-367]|uniref:GNAT family N-acetyltransferase n=1 Tax=Eudoraea algarum TaxID=3417568 RepID=UPI0032881D12
MVDLQPHLEGDLVLLRPLRAEDYQALFAVASDVSIWEQHPTKDRYTPAGFLPFFEESLNASGAMVIVDATSGEIIGSSRFKMIDEAEKIVEIGWTFLAKKYWGGRYNRAIKKLMVNHILEKGGTVVLYVDKTNIRSQRAVLKIGGRPMLDTDFKYHHAMPSNLTYIVTEIIRD